MTALHFRAQPKTATKSATAGKAAPGKPDIAAHEKVSGQFVVHFAKIDELRRQGFSNDEIYDIVGSRRTLARRKERNETLTSAESDRALRLERISTMADRVFADHEKAQRWLRKRSRVLNALPIELLRSETGAALVEEELHRIDYGIFS